MILLTVSSKEKDFEDAIVKVLYDGGYEKRKPSDFDKKLCLDSELFAKFVEDTQPESWKKLLEDNTEEEILKKLVDEIENSSMIDVIRNGFSIYDVDIDCAFFKPVNKKDADHEKQYQKNILSVIRQAQYDNEGHELDLLLCLNGLPVATAELKEKSKSQTYKNAIKQYQEDRDPRNTLLKFKRGALVHFAIDAHEVHMTTKLQDSETNFIPFNKGRNGGYGNPDNPNGYRTAYLWEQIWQKEIWLDIIGNFIFYLIEQQPSPLPPKESIIFPRYHQLESVRNIAANTKQVGPGNNYLIEHSTGSGKSKSIAWLAYKLFSLHNENDNPVFDSVIVLSDRIVIVDQLEETIKQFETTAGVVEKAGTSSELATNLETSRIIHISTQQKFPFVIDKISKIKGRNFAIIIDEAHSSQSGDSAEKVREVLANNDYSDQEAKEEESTPDITDKIIAENMRARGPSNHLSYYAFTATPKKNTLQLFGTKVSENEYEPFHKYTMNQAIQEGFILDVLKNYTTYDSHFRLLHTSSKDKIVDNKTASRKVMNYVDTHPERIDYLAEWIVEHFRKYVLPTKIGGLAKAMVVSSSRNQARLYKLAIDEYVKSKNYHDVNALVAFTGSLKDEHDNIYTEHSMNNVKTDKETTENFNKKEYNILIVAEKYQTGYDQDKLHTMYVDKKLKGIKIVQSLSRLNRTRKGKTDTLVVDFKNTVDEIEEGYAKYYSGTSLIDKTTSDYIFKLFTEIIELGIITQKDLDYFAQVFFDSSSGQGKLYAAVDGAIQRFDDADEQDQDKLLKLLKIYIDVYSILSFIVRYDDKNLEKLNAILKFLRKWGLLRGSGLEEPDLEDDLSLQFYRLEKTHEGEIPLDDSKKPLTINESSGTVKTPDVMTSLSAIIDAINERFAGDIRTTPAEEIIIQKWIEDLLKDTELRQIAKANRSEDDFLKKFDEKLRNKMLESPEEHYELVSKIFKNGDLLKTIISLAGKPFHEGAQKDTLPPIRPCSPAENRLQFGQRIHDCHDFVNWVDLYLKKEGVEFLLDRINDNVKEIKILTGLYNNEREINEELHEYVVMVIKELEQKGISLEMRIVTGKTDWEDTPHDRYLIGKNIVYSVPSYTTMVKGRYSEFHKTENIPPFAESWNAPNSFDIVKNWEKIKKIRNAQRPMYSAKCSKCGKDCEVPFKPDPGRPVYCQEHRPQKR